DPDALPKSYLNQNRVHKLIISSNNSDDSAVYDQLVQQNAIRSEINYNSFKLVVVDEEAVGGRAALQALRIAPSDEQNMIPLNGTATEPSTKNPLSKEWPENLKLPGMAEAKRGGYNPSKGLYIVQFAGPIQDAWLNVLESPGADGVSYISNNAYVVRCDDRS